MTDEELTAKSNAIFAQACEAFERLDMEEHERLRLAHRDLLERHRLEVERDTLTVH